MPHDQSPPLSALVLVHDILFGSKITATARANGVNICVIRACAELTDQPAPLLIVDLNLAGAIEAAAAWKRATHGQIVGFVSHVDRETIDRARAAGFDQVLARSRFVQILPDLLK